MVRVAYITVDKNQFLELIQVYVSTFDYEDEIVKQIYEQLHFNKTEQKMHSSVRTLMVNWVKTKRTNTFFKKEEKENKPG